ncbi:hypothetical protein GH714_002542 [Hevea brasiliensis]|uniref:Vacuolar fusion protein MON1 homolog n=1 Tax=Hevea brasiliensis TaxID=3981 RepID=A0A6A6N6F2_HEVBR|nr:hypothetical protein GH714_002542 [Hevea brasiliensis]
MSSTSSSSSGDGPQTNSKPLENQFESFTIEESNSIVQNDEATAEPQLESSFNGSLDDNGNHEEFNALEERIEVGSEVRGIGDSGDAVVWRRTNSELKVDGPSSPSSSGYAGERGSSSVTSASRIGEVSEDEIQEAGNDGDVDGNLDSQAAWVPGKRHVDEGDRVKLVRAGKHQVVFLVKGPIYLVCISCTEEPYESLKGQLELIYSQMILILTKSVNRCFEKNPKFDMTPLLGGTDVVFSSLIHSFSWNPATFLHAYTCLPLAYATRQAAGAILQDVTDSGVFFAILMSKHKVDTYLMLLTTSSDAFYHLKDCRIRIEMVLLKSNVLSEVQRSMLDGGMHVEDLPGDPLPRSGTASPHLGQHKLPTDHPERFRESYLGIGGPAGLWHFISQYISGSIYYRAYQKVYASMHDKGNGPHKTQFRRDENYVLLCWVTPDFELYAAFDPLADKALAIKTCNRVCQWVKDVENEIFLLGASPFSW